MSLESPVIAFWDEPPQDDCLITIGSVDGRERFFLCKPANRMWAISEKGVPIWSYAESLSEAKGIAVSWANQSSRDTLSLIESVV